MYYKAGNSLLVIRVTAVQKSPVSHAWAVGAPPVHHQVRETQRAGLWVLCNLSWENSIVPLAPKIFISHLKNQCRYFDKNITENAPSKVTQPVPLSFLLGGARAAWEDGGKDGRRDGWMATATRRPRPGQQPPLACLPAKQRRGKRVKSLDSLHFMNNHHSTGFLWNV